VDAQKKDQDTKETHKEEAETSDIRRRRQDEDETSSQSE